MDGWYVGRWWMDELMGKCIDGRWWWVDLEWIDG